MSISEDSQRQDKFSDNYTRLVNPVLVSAVPTDDQPGPIVFLAITNKFDIATQALCEPPATQKTQINSNQGNNTTEKNYNNGRLILIIKVILTYLMYWIF